MLERNSNKYYIFLSACARACVCGFLHAWTTCVCVGGCTGAWARACASASVVLLFSAGKTSAPCFVVRDLSDSTTFYDIIS
jgi:hypothetical protein